jgi:hypothetical protein
LSTSGLCCIIIFSSILLKLSIEENGKKLGGIGKIEEGKIEEGKIDDNSFLLCSFCTGIVVVKERAKEDSN